MKIKTEPLISVGIIKAHQVDFRLEGNFGNCVSSDRFTGDFQARSQDELIHLVKDGEIIWSGEQLVLEPHDNKTSVFCLSDVTIGVNFHWEQKEDQCFQGALKLMLVDEKIQVINVVALEIYLESVISSEMRPSASLAFLKAHAVISRGWLLSQLEKSGTSGEDKIRKKGEWLTWYDNEDHLHFDVCADDHCQRYQGVARINSEKARQAVSETRGEVLLSNGELCDARFSKCCGGVSEKYSSCWDDQDFPYLMPVRDNWGQQNPGKYDLQKDEDAEQWIYEDPEAFCNTDDPRILIQVLNEYDQETRDFFRWRRDVSQDWLKDKVRQMLGVDLGDIVDLIPVKRGTSGRIIKLNIQGTGGQIVVGKELEIRKLLSDTHLYSSAFIVEKVNVEHGIPEGFILKGAGWGHGVGLCQIGAAVMGVKGYDYNEILSHYFKETNIEKLYE